MVVQGREVAASGRGRSSELPPLHESWLPSEHPLHRPRHGARQRSALVCAALFLLLPVVSLGFGASTPEIENRRLASFPAPTGWHFFTDLPTWASDHLPFRGAAVDAAGGVSRGLFGEPPPLGQAARQGQDPRAGSVGPIAPPRQADLDDPAPGFTSVIEGRDGWLYLGDDIKGKCQPATSVDQVIGQLDRLRRAAAASGRTFVLVVAPDKTTMVPEWMPRRYAGADCADTRRDEFWRRVVAEAGALDVRQPLRDAADELGGGKPLYFQRDTHWTFGGGLVMTRAIADAVLPGTTRTWRSVHDGPWTGPSDLPPLLGQHATNECPLWTLAPDGRGDRAISTTDDFRAPLRFARSASTGIVPGTTTMFADSYTRFALPFLGAAFSDLTVLHLESARADVATATSLVAGSDTVVVEVVERHLSVGLSQITDPVFVDDLTRAMASNPR